jgi:hypothetical protein
MKIIQFKKKKTLLVSKVFLTKKFKKGGHHDNLEFFSKYNDKEHQNSKKQIISL